MPWSSFSECWALSQLFFKLTGHYLEKFSSIVRQLASRGWHWVNNQEIKTLYYCTTVVYTVSTIQQSTQKHSYLKRMHKSDNVSQMRELTMWLDMQMHVCIFESSQLKGSYVWDLLYWYSKHIQKHHAAITVRSQHCILIHPSVIKFFLGISNLPGTI